MKKLLFKNIKRFMLGILLILIFIIYQFKGAILLSFEVIKDLKTSNESIQVLAQLSEYRALNTMSIKGLKFKESKSGTVSFDIYSSNTSTPSPVIIYVHGGSWMYGNNGIPENIKPVIQAFNNKGFTIISLTYELLKDDIQMSTPISDVKDAIRWVHKNHKTYNLNPDEIGILGVSSGAHLALMAAYSNDDDFKGDEIFYGYSSKVKYIIDVFGPSDLSTLDFSSVEEDLKESISAIKNMSFEHSSYSPINYVGENSPPTLIIHSKNDPLVPYTNATSLHKKLQEFKIPTKLISLESSGHNITASPIETAILIFETLKFLTENSPL